MVLTIHFGGISRAYISFKFQYMSCNVRSCPKVVCNARRAQAPDAPLQVELGVCRMVRCGGRPPHQAMSVTLQTVQLNLPSPHCLHGLLILAPSDLLPCSSRRRPPAHRQFKVRLCPQHHSAGLLVQAPNEPPVALTSPPRALASSRAHKYPASNQEPLLPAHPPATHHRTPSNVSHFSIYSSQCPDSKHSSTLHTMHPRSSTRMQTTSTRPPRSMTRRGARALTMSPRSSHPLRRPCHTSRDGAASTA